MSCSKGEESTNPALRTVVRVVDDRERDPFSTASRFPVKVINENAGTLDFGEQPGGRFVLNQISEVTGHLSRTVGGLNDEFYRLSAHQDMLLTLADNVPATVQWQIRAEYVLDGNFMPIGWEGTYAVHLKAFPNVEAQNVCIFVTRFTDEKITDDAVVRLEPLPYDTHELPLDQYDTFGIIRRLGFVMPPAAE